MFTTFQDKNFCFSLIWFVNKTWIYIFQGIRKGHSCSSDEFWDKASTTSRPCCCCWPNERETCWSNVINWFNFVINDWNKYLRGKFVRAFYQQISLDSKLFYSPSQNILQYLQKYFFHASHHCIEWLWNQDPSMPFNLYKLIYCSNLLAQIIFSCWNSAPQI